MPSPAVQLSLAVQTWARIFKAHAALVRAFNADMLATHGLTLNDFEALWVLAAAPDRRLRRVDLAGRVRLTASGITRLLDGLERAGYVTRKDCRNDARVVYAELTEAGAAKLEEAAATHLRDIEEIFEARYSDDELHTLGELVSRLPGALDEDCS